MYVLVINLCSSMTKNINKAPNNVSLTGDIAYSGNTGINEYIKSKIKRYINGVFNFFK